MHQIFYYLQYTCQFLCHCLLFFELSLYDPFSYNITSISFFGFLILYNIYHSINRIENFKRYSIIYVSSVINLPFHHTNDPQAPNFLVNIMRSLLSILLHCLPVKRKQTLQYSVLSSVFKYFFTVMS